MNTEFFAALEMLEKEKGIPKEYMYEKVEAALQSAYKKDQDGYSNVKVVVDPVKKEVKMYQLKEVVDEIEDEVTQISLVEARKLNHRYNIGDIVEIEMKLKNFRRLGATAAKHVIIQAVREAERGMLIKEYENKREEIITATVLRVDEITGNATVDTGTSIATLIKNEQIPGERYKENERIKVYVTEVRKESHGPIVTLSRTHPGLVKRLFELEIPEIQDGTVIIKGVVREAGSRSKVAVMSRDDNVDPIGACVGTRSMRIQNIIDELGGEKIDIVKYSDIPEEYISAALSPAVINKVVIEDERVCRVFVDPDQLSLAIGKEGQNARLAAKLTGYKIDIKTG